MVETFCLVSRHAQIERDGKRIKEGNRKELSAEIGAPEV